MIDKHKLLEYLTNRWNSVYTTYRRVLVTNAEPRQQGYAEGYSAGMLDAYQEIKRVVLQETFGETGDAS